jgi:hypothetical protein
VTTQACCKQVIRDVKATLAAMRKHRKKEKHLHIWCKSGRHRCASEENRRIHGVHSIPQLAPKCVRLFFSGLLIFGVSVFEQLCSVANPRA